MNSKIDCAEYLLDCLIQKSKNQGKDMGISKFLNLLFLTVGFSCDENETGLLDIFNDFTFFPSGFFENDVRKYILRNQFKKYELTDCNYSIKKQGIQFDGIDLSVKKMISDAVNEIITKNSDIIDLNFFDIVDIIQRWSCWKICKNVCQERHITNTDLHRNKYHVPLSVIQKSVRYFSAAPLYLHLVI